MADKFTEEEIEDFRKAFQLLDTEERGRIHRKNLGLMLRSVGENPTDKTLIELVNKLQVFNGFESSSPWIDFTDFLYVLSEIRHDEGEEIKYVFGVFDKEQTGSMKTGELRSVLKFLKDDVPGEDIDDMLADFDLDGDGSIHYEEFYKVMAFNTKQREERAKVKRSESMQESKGKDRRKSSMKVQFEAATDLAE